MGNKNTTWRETRVSIPPLSNVDITDFKGTSPNMFYIYNYSISDLYCGLNTVPTPYQKEYVVNGTSSLVIGKPTSVSALCLYNPSQDRTLDIYITSVEDEFDLNVMKSYNVQIEGEVVSEQIREGLVNGFQNFSKDLSSLEETIVSAISALIESLGGEGIAGSKKSEEIFYQNTILEFDELNNIKIINLVVEGKKFSFINDGKSDFLIHLLDSQSEIISTFPVYADESLTDIKLNSLIKSIKIENVTGDSCKSRLFIEGVLTE